MSPREMAFLSSTNPYFSVSLALPFAYYIMKNWLEGFAYRIELNLFDFILGGSLVLLLALVTIITQTVKSAQINITESLHTDG